MDFTQYAMAVFVLIGLVNGIQLGLNREWKSFIMFVVVVIVGSTFGYFKLFGLPGFEVGLAVAISSSGVYKVAQKIGNT